MLSNKIDFTEVKVSKVRSLFTATVYLSMLEELNLDSILHLAQSASYLKYLRMLPRNLSKESEYLFDILYLPSQTRQAIS